MNCKKIILLLALILMSLTANVEAAENESPFEILTSTYVDGANDAVALVKAKSTGEFYFMLATKDGQRALIPYTRKIYDFYKIKTPDGYPPLIFLMMVLDQNRGQVDDDLGEWKGNLHAIPVYVLFDVENDQLQLSQTFWSATGTMSPSHFQAEIKNQNNIRLIKAFISHIPGLHEQVDSKGIVLP